MTSIFDIRDKAIESFKQISTAQGYSMTVDPDKVIARYNEALLSQTDDATYPKFMIFAERGNYSKGVGASETRTGEVNLFIVLRSTDPEVKTSTLIEAVVADVERWNRSDLTLGNTVTSFDLINMVTDGGVADPEGIALFKFMARWDDFGS
jgi:hypothetical protein